ncbi:hypothetical protein SpCBS45565_g05488 [Spizellomyces sp. 'palustris']|nr:hypothetical protein SpCBS45565_g05488 [Spizellomyces sp. 'palustris']
MDRHRSEIPLYTPPHRKDRPIHAWETEPQPVVHAWETAPQTDRNTRHRKPKPNEKHHERPCQVSGNTVFGKGQRVPREPDRNDGEELNPYLPIPPKPQRRISPPSSPRKPRARNDHPRGRSNDTKGTQKQQDTYVASDTFFDRSPKPHDQSKELNPSCSQERISPSSSPRKPRVGNDHPRGRSNDTKRTQKHERDTYEASVHTFFDRKAPKPHDNQNDNPKSQGRISPHTRSVSSPRNPSVEYQDPSTKVDIPNNHERSWNEDDGNTIGERNEWMEKESPKDQQNVTNWADADTEFDYSDIPIWDT